MTKPQTTIEFAGIDANGGNNGMPRWFRSAVGARMDKNAEFPSFNEAVRDLPTAQKTKVAYQDDESGEWTKDARHVALVNPAWLGDGLADAPQNTAVWHIPTGSYSVVNPMDGYGPFCAVMRAHNADDENDELGDVFGQFRLYRNGGEVHGDIVFDGLRVADPRGTDQPYALGVTTGYDFFGGHALYAEVIAYDTRNGAVMRGLSDTKSRRHVGSAGTTVASWWESVLDAMETASETLFEVIADARDYVVDFSEYPFGVAEYYELLGFPEYLSEQAADRVGQSVSRADAFTLYHAMTETLAEDYDGKDGASTMTKYVNAANDILYTPPKAERKAIDAKVSDLKGQATLSPEDEDAAEALAKKRETAGESIEKFGATRARLKNLLAEAEASA